MSLNGMQFAWKIGHFPPTLSKSVIFMIFLKNCNFSNKETKRESISLENLMFFIVQTKFGHFLCKLPKWYNIWLENLYIFHFSLKTNDTPFTFGYRPEYIFKLK